ncbi:MAG TPA: PEP-CTERM sorting domain-containing protein [Armatimonadota bacterium]
MKHPSLRAYLYTAAAAALLLIPLQTRATPGTFVPAAGRRDMAYDQQRGVLYITSGADLLRYSVTSNAFLPSWSLGGSLAGIDLSPDGNRLAVADSTRTEGQVWIHDVDLQTGVSRKAYFDRSFGEGGTFSVAFGGDGAVVTSSTFEGSGWTPLRRYDPATGATSVLTPGGMGSDYVTQDCMLSASADGSVIGFEESDISDGRFGRYRVADRSLLRKQWYADGTSWFNYEIGVSRNGTQYALPTYGGAYICDADLHKNAIIGAYAGGQPVGVAYSPVADIVYFPWAGTNEIRSYDTNTLKQIGSFDFGGQFYSPGNHAFQMGRLKMSRDGTLLFSTVNGGVRFMRVADPVPEPTSALLLLAGAIPAIGVWRRRAARQ